MGIPAKNLAAAKKYLHTMNKNFLKAWEMGFHDADAGRDHPHPMPGQHKAGHHGICGGVLRPRSIHHGIQSGKEGA